MPYSRLAKGEVTQRQYDQAAEEAHIIWKRNNFPMQRGRYGGHPYIPDRLAGEFDRLVNYLVDNPLTA